MKYLLGIDAGSTKTSVTAYGINGETLRTARGRDANFSALGKNALKNVLDVVLDCTSGLDGCPAFIMIGASGLRGAGLSSWVEDELVKKYRCPVKAVDDGVMAMKATLDNTPGVLVISGTGSVVYAQNGDAVVSVGGWGHLLDEKGCGSSISLDALKSITSNYDAGNPTTSFGRAVLSYLGLESPLCIPSFVYRSSKSEFSRLALLVEQEANRGEAEALAILENAGVELAEMVSTAITRLSIVRPRIATSGSLIVRCPYVRKSFEDMVQSKCGSCQIENTIVKPERAVIVAYKEISDGNQVVQA
jgi:N-acetylglucosamine kinase-like BadF-type ATPase